MKTIGYRSRNGGVLRSRRLYIIFIIVGSVFMTRSMLPSQLLHSDLPRNDFHFPEITVPTDPWSPLRQDEHSDGKFTMAKREESSTDERQGYQGVHRSKFKNGDTILKQFGGEVDHEEGKAKSDDSILEGTDEARKQNLGQISEYKEPAGVLSEDVISWEILRKEDDSLFGVNPLDLDEIRAYDEEGFRNEIKINEEERRKEKDSTDYSSMDFDGGERSRNDIWDYEADYSDLDYEKSELNSEDYASEDESGENEDESFEEEAEILENDHGKIRKVDEKVGQDNQNPESMKSKLEAIDTSDEGTILKQNDLMKNEALNGKYGDEDHSETDFRRPPGNENGKGQKELEVSATSGGIHSENGRNKTKSEDIDYNRDKNYKRNSSHNKEALRLDTELKLPKSKLDGSDTFGNAIHMDTQHSNETPSRINSESKGAVHNTILTDSDKNIYSIYESATKPNEQANELSENGKAYESRRNTDFNDRRKNESREKQIYPDTAISDNKLINSPQNKSLNEDEDKYHVVVSVGDGLYTEWQVRVCYYWYNKIKQLYPNSAMGGFTRLLHSGEEDEWMDEIPTVVVDPLPEEIIEKANGYVVLNRPYAFRQWVDKHLDKIPEKYVLMAEPDHLFIKPPPLLASPNKAAAFPFHYIDHKASINQGIVQRFNEKNISLDEFFPVGNSPVMISKERMGPIVERWVNVSLAVNADPEADSQWGWVQEMFAWSIASALDDKGPLQYSLHKELMLQPPWDSTLQCEENGKDAYMIHYTYGFDFDENGEFTPGEVGVWHWDKRDFMKKYPPIHSPLPSSKCKNVAVRTVIHLINQAAADLPGWEERCFKEGEAIPVYSVNDVIAKRKAIDNSTEQSPTPA